MYGVIWYQLAYLRSEVGVCDDGLSDLGMMQRGPKWRHRELYGLVRGDRSVHAERGSGVSTIDHEGV